MKKIISIILLSILSVQIHAQNKTRDSLLLILNQTTSFDTLNINAISQLGLMYQHINVDSLIIIANKVIQESKNLDYTNGLGDGYKLLGIAHYMKFEKSKAIYFDSVAIGYYSLTENNKGVGAVYNNLGVLFAETGEYQTANKYYKKSLELRRITNDLKGIGDSYANLGNNYLSLGNYPEALKNTFLGIRYRQQINNQIGLSNSYMNLGTVYYQLGELKKAEHYIRKCIQLSEEIGNLSEMSNRLINLGGVQYFIGKYDSAIVSFQKAATIAKEQQNIESLILAYSNLGDTYMAKQQYEKALETFNEAFSLLNDDTDNRYKSTLYSSIGAVYGAKGEYPKAITFTEKGYELAIADNNKPTLKNITELLSKYHEKNNNLGLALKFHKIYAAYKDSLLGEETKQKTKDLEVAFEFEQKERAITLLEKDNKLKATQNKYQQAGLIILIILLMWAITSFILTNNSRKKLNHANILVNQQKVELEVQAEKLKSSIAFKDRLFSILAHDLRSPLSSITSLITLSENNLIEQEEFLSMRSKLKTSIESLTMLLDNLLTWGKKQINQNQQANNAVVDLNELIQRNVQLLNESARNKNIVIHVSIEPKSKLVSDANHIDLILRNLLSNAIKFTASGNVHISCKKVENDIELSIQDNGIGMDATTLRKLEENNFYSKSGTSGERGTGLGIMLCKEFIDMNKGKLIINSKPGEGTTVSVRFPIV
jgi:signal transduction histidine kinase/Tfp pilus assembly protein PilF